LLELAAGQWARNDPSGAIDWAKQLPAGEERDRFIAGISTTWMQTSPEQAAQLVSSGMEPGYYQSETIVSVVSEWARSAPGDVAVWARDFPDGPLRDRVMDGLMTQWMTQDPQKAAQWVKALERGRVSDSAVQAFIRNLIPSDPATAAHWAESIDSDTQFLKESQMELVARAWLASGDPAAKTWVEKGQFPPETKSRLLATAGK
jgi:hypothetical protein